MPTLKFKLNPCNGKDLVRKGVVLEDSKVKGAAFKIDILQVHFLKAGEDPDLDSDKILGQKKQNSCEQVALYEWVNDIGFQKVNPQKQSWFKVKNFVNSVINEH